ncbi:MAG TPA: response regulator transcription factor [Acidobacteriota bacterium]|nr:response regulator transcription factor [Acidobacteriota bacterium]
MTKIRVFLADDHPAMLEKIVDLMESTYEIVGTATDGRTALNEVACQCPDVLLMDISMPIMNGIEAAENLIRMGTKTKIIFLTVHDDPDFIKAALATGASGYVIKSHVATDLIPAIREALAGHRFISPCIRTMDSGQP